MQMRVMEVVDEKIYHWVLLLSFFVRLHCKIMCSIKLSLQNSWLTNSTYFSHTYVSNICILLLLTMKINDFIIIHTDNAIFVVAITTKRRQYRCLDSFTKPRNVLINYYYWHYTVRLTLWCMFKKCCKAVVGNILCVTQVQSVIFTLESLLGDKAALCTLAT